MRNKLNTKNCPPMLLCDFYKVCHNAMYPDGMTKLVSYLTPRMSRIKGSDFLISFGMQAFCRTYLHDYFDEFFFNRNKEDVVAEYERILKHSIGEGTYNSEKIIALYDLGYLPIEIRIIPEGTKVPIKVPMVEISNTHPDFAWVTNAIESLMSCYLWHPMVCANIGYYYREIVNYWYNKTVEDNIPRNTALGDFSMRGQESLESAITSSAGFALSFLNTATVPCITYLENNYYCDIEKEPVIKGAVSTEHSVMCFNYAVDGDETTLVKKLLNKVYPNNNFSMVSDSYDYWNMLTNIIPSCKEDILNHNGTLIVRPDSGNPVDIVCGELKKSDYMEVDGLTENIEEIKKYFIKKAEEDFIGNSDGVWYRVKIANKLYTVHCDYATEPDIDDPDIYVLTPTVYPDEVEIECKEITPAMKGSVEVLWDIFGGTINSKGYKVLNSKIRVIYGDGITLTRAKEIYNRLEEKGFASNNVSFGVGSFSHQCMEMPDGSLQPFTRDTYSIAVKATYGEINGKPYEIFKNPKTDTGHFKKSQKGCCVVYFDADGDIWYEDGHNWEDSRCGIMKTIFKDSEMVNEDSLSNIRNRLHNNEF